MEQHTGVGAPTPPDIHALMAAHRRRQEESEAAGLPALERLIKVAKGNSGQSQHIRRFLLGLYNGPEWPLEMTRLRALDADIQDDVLAVLRMDMTPRCEVHTRIEGCDAFWPGWWHREAAFDADQNG